MHNASPDVKNGGELGREAASGLPGAFQTEGTRCAEALGWQVWPMPGRGGQQCGWDPRLARGQAELARGQAEQAGPLRRCGLIARASKGCDVIQVVFEDENVGKICACV